jgi:thymidylate synthase (FAD)
VKTTLISITPDAEKTIMYCARVSNPKNQDSEKAGLLKYCLDHGHFSIFEMANMVIEIQTSRAISAQIIRHRSFSFQEFSQRYAEATGFETYPARRQDQKNRQNSVDDMSETDRKWFDEAQEANHVFCELQYDEALRRGIAKEQARFLLPLSTSTKLYMNGTIRSWIHYIDTRTEQGTQREHKEIAESIKKIFCEQLPIIAAAKGWI